MGVPRRPDLTTDFLWPKPLDASRAGLRVDGKQLQDAIVTKGAADIKMCVCFGANQAERSGIARGKRRHQDSDLILT